METKMKESVIFILLLFQHVFCKVDTTWWKHTTLYEVYLPSFKDSNGDGIGDLRGLTSKLDHIADLGIKTVYVSPFYMSPMEEGGYDISNFTAVNPIFGTIEDFNELVAEASKRGLKLIIDVVLNHSSDKHEWFVKSVQRVEPYTNFYVWKDGKYDSNGNRGPPNNWVSVFGGSAWQWNEERKQFYFHQFTAQQPDFNLRDKAVKKEMKKMLKFWLDRGVAGFRLDATNFLIEDADFRDEPLASADIKVATTMWDLVHIYTLFTQESFDFLHEIRVYVDRITKKFTDYERILVPETYAMGKLLTKYYGTDGYKITHFPLNFALVLITDFQNATFYKEIIDTYLNSLPEGATPTWNSENHDKFRKASVFGEEYEFIFTTMVLTLPGVAYIYYGQEIGMTGSRIRDDQQVDKFVDDFTKKPRDSARLPMQWDDTLNGGFSSNTRTHLPLTPNYWRINVRRQKDEESSHYHLFKKLMALRETDAFKYGAFKSYVISTWVFAFTRISQMHETYLIIINLGSETELVDVKHSIPELGEVMKVEVASANSAYKSDEKIRPMTYVMSKIMVLRPLAVVILSSNRNEFVETVE